MKEVEARLSESGNLTVTLTDAAMEWLGGEGVNDNFGARPLKRAIQRFVESPLAIRLLKGEFVSGDHIMVAVNEDEDGLTFTKKINEL